MNLDNDTLSIDIAMQKEYNLDMANFVTAPDTDRKWTLEYEERLQCYGLHPRCESCAKSCITYNAPNLTRFICLDFKRRR